ncbi:arylamine N-acetyltransferase family protein [Mobilicoccus caccae]|uniref:N-hydroxyarylamine O-acetyltransferase n=1 Tax=Mobilicoccus caccae TaxID=1859295 RepID=A0ABQ6IJZ0_9MICO|nr:arylamine N-acetyltransferase [Mobilicoccus caccae]GMA38044.1 hypothetical protein GCM10025883_00890 [Mobilicoccus caccae]
MPPTTLVGPSWRTAEFDVPAYLESIGLASAGGPGPSLEPTSEVLSEVHSAHVRTLPFANVDVLLGQHPGIAPVTVHDQLVRRRRGGYCFEHTQLFAAALEYVGFTFRRALGRVRDVAGSRTHMTVVVRLDGREVLCDPGFGFSITSPIELRAGATQEVAGREFRIERWNVAGVGTWALTREGALEHVHDDLPVQPVDVTMGHLMTSTGADSPSGITSW